MKRLRFTEEQIIGVLREQEAGAKTAEVCRKHGVSEATFYKRMARPVSKLFRDPVWAVCFSVSGLRSFLGQDGDPRSPLLIVESASMRRS
jgi:Transposase